MFRSLAIIPILTAVVLAQTTSSLIPQGISSSCSQFLDNLNNDTTITTCTSAITQATASFAKASSSAAVTSALDALCAPSIDTACPSDLLTSKITAFYTACTAELTSNPNPQVVLTYDVLYTIYPYRGAICSKDDSGNYCSAEAQLPSGTTAEAVQAIMASPSPANSEALMPNPTTFKNYGVAFMFLTNITSAQCNDCTRKIVNSYMNFQSITQYAPGFGHSALLSGQPSIYASIETQCGSTFLASGSAVKAAGGLSGGTLGGTTSGAVQVSGIAAGLVASGVSVVALIASSWL